MVAPTLPDRGQKFPLGGNFPPRVGQESSPELMLMLLADARLPTGAHTQSAGLEPAMRHGVSVAEVPELIAARLSTVTAVEAGTAVVARHLAVGEPLVRTGRRRRRLAGPDGQPGVA